jgi:hypothetical protein
MDDILYTNVIRIGSKIAFRGINLETNKRVQGKQDYFPTLFLESQKKTSYQTLEGNFLRTNSAGQHV